MKIACTDRKMYLTDTRGWTDEALSLGISCMEIAVGHLPEDEAEQDEIISYALSRGIELNLHAPFGINNISSLDSERSRSSVANVKRSIDLAAKHGLGVVTFHPGRLSTEDEDSASNIERMMNIVSDIAEYAKEKRVRVSLENMERRPFEIIFTVDDLNRFAHLGEGNPYFGVTVDFAHYSSHGIGMPDLSALKLPLFDVHLSQNVEGKMHRALTNEDGRLDISEVCRRLSEYGYDGMIVLEVIDNVFESCDILAREISALKA